jgi:hypothetical protein
MSLYCPDADQTAAACARAKGWPAPNIESGDGTPEAAVTGYFDGQLYADSTNSKIYAFFGVAGENTGWVILN